jgi:hypothetical protein
MQEQFELSGLTETIGPEHFYPTAQAAVQAFVSSQGSPA